MYICFFGGSKEEPFRAIRLPTAPRSDFQVAAADGLLACLYIASRRKQKANKKKKKDYLIAPSFDHLYALWKVR
jgi:hypothetical protein